MIRQQPDFEAIQRKMENPEVDESAQGVQLSDRLVSQLGDASWGVFVPCTGEDDAQYMVGAVRAASVVINNREMAEVRRRITDFEDLVTGSLIAQETIADRIEERDRALEAVKILAHLIHTRVVDSKNLNLCLLKEKVPVLAGLSDLLELDLTVSDVIPPEER